jgi:hypothetical protein
MKDGPGHHGFTTVWFAVTEHDLMHNLLLKNISQDLNSNIVLNLINGVPEFSPS